MNELTLQTPQKSALFCGEGALSKLLSRKEELKRRGALLAVDETVCSLFQNEIKSFSLPVFSIESSAAKNFGALKGLLQRMAEASLKRSSVLISIGGGSVLDLGGLASSLYMRGIESCYAPTTLLSQADAAVGGKTAIDFLGIKNLIGSFYFPQNVYFDPLFLKTLPPREIRSGLGEMIKHGALKYSLFEALLNSDFSIESLSSMIFEHIKCKGEIVEADPFDTGKRICLNLGHTTAHLLERGPLSHGECVMEGLVLEGRIAKRRGLGEEMFLSALEALCLRFVSLPKTISQSLFARARLDKKNGEKICLIAPAGKSRFEKIELSFEEYQKELISVL